MFAYAQLPDEENDSEEGIEPKPVDERRDSLGHVAGIVEDVAGDEEKYGCNDHERGSDDEADIKDAERGGENPEGGRTFRGRGIHVRKFSGKRAFAGEGKQQDSLIGVGFCLGVGAEAKYSELWPFHPLEDGGAPRRGAPLKSSLL